MDNEKRKKLSLIIISFFVGLGFGYYLCKYGLKLPRITFTFATPASYSPSTVKPGSVIKTATPTPTPFTPPGQEKK